MEICVWDTQKFVEIWLTQEEKHDAGLRKKLNPLYRKYRAKNFLVAVFLPGERDLADATSDLLCHNRKRVAQLEARRNKTDMAECKSVPDK